MSKNSFIEAFFKGIFKGDGPEIITTYLETGVVTAFLKKAISTNIRNILTTHPRKKFKIGKTGHPLTRAEQDDYRKSSYSKMYLLYRSTLQNRVSELEAYYIQKYYSRNDNINPNSVGTMKSPDGYYYLYLVI